MIFELQPRRTARQVLANKKTLLTLPPGTPRPQRGTKLGNALANYILRCNLMYDPAFDDAVRERYPHWFAVDLRKEELLRLPPGSPKPTPATAPLLRDALHRYTDPKHPRYDPDFDTAVRAQHPRWFMDPVSLNKAELLDLPDGSPRPSNRKALGHRLSGYLNPQHPNYDPAFTAVVRQRFPHWLSGLPAANKAALLALPTDAPRPRLGTTLGNALANYTQKSTTLYDPSFDAAVRKRFPLWFAGKAANNKAAILALPEGSPRPHHTSRLGVAMAGYVHPSSPGYDSAFTAAVRERFPHWFNRPADPNGHKAAILALPPGSPKPAWDTPLGQSLRSYLRPSLSGYDAVFAAAVRERFPHWLEATRPLMPAVLTFFKG